MRRYLALFVALLWVGAAQAQFYQQAPPIGTAGGTSNALTFNVPNATSLADLVNVILTITPASTNSAAATLSVNSLAAKPIKKASNSGLVALSGNELISGQPTQLFYDGNEYVLVGGIGNSGVIPPPTGTHGIVTFNTAGTYSFTVPANVFWIRVSVTGGGAGGEFNNGIGQTTHQGQGGGAGGTAIAWLSVSPSQIISGVTVGAGGIGGAPVDQSAGNGGASTFSYLTGNGGTGGVNFTSLGGTATGGQINITGGKGQQPDPSWQQIGQTQTSLNWFGIGGSSYYGPTTNEIAGIGGGGNGQNGQFGSGGSGCTSNVVSCHGGNGGDGLIVVEW